MTPNSTIAHYRIISKIGEGGMGAVYRATDTKLARDVAIKVLPAAFASDPDRLARFTREAQLLASLNHPNIATIHGIEENAIVMELVEGPTLADRIAQGALPLDEALSIARQIAEALETAHEKGIIHRDLKPANVKVTADGKVKVLDFGLAKLADPVEPAGDPATSPTVVRGNSPTLAGMIMGTAGYMAPEQARGMRVDKRADIWAFGVVLFEMLSGTQTFGGHTIADQMASVLKTDPDWNALPAGTPSAVKKVLRRCLERDRKRRLQDIGDVRMELEEHEPDTPPAPAVAPPKPSSGIWIAATAIATLAAVTLGALYVRRKPPEAQMVRFTISPSMDDAAAGSTTPRTGSFGNWIGASPDGRSVAFRANGGDGAGRLWIRPVDSLSARPLIASDGEGWAFWSPDSRYIVFQSAGKLRKVEVTGGPPTTLCDVSEVFLGGTWNGAGTILFGTNATPIRKVSSSGGMATPATILDSSRKEWKHSDPFFLPDGRHFVYLRSSRDPEYSGVYVGSLDDKPEQQNMNRLVATEFSPVYTPAAEGSQTGYLMYLREGTLVAQEFDARSLRLSGDAIPLAEQIATSVSRASFSASSNRILAYRQGDSSTFASWMDRTGRPLGQPGQLGSLTSLSLSPDGKQLAYTLIATGREREVWVSDLAGRNSKFSFTTDGGQNPVWSPDGRQIVFSSASGRGTNLYRKAANGGGSEVPLLRGPSRAFPNHWSPDGKFLLFTTARLGRIDELWLLPDPGGPEPAGGRKPVPFLQSQFDTAQGQFSPDSRWVAYASNESGRMEVYVRPFPTSSGEGKWLVSSGGGFQPRWRRDGKELFYLGPDGRLMAAEIVTQPVFQAKPAKVLFNSFLPISTTQVRYDVSADGNRFLIASQSGASSSPITVVLNWAGMLKK